MEQIAKKIRRNCLDLLRRGGAHIGGALSCVDILVSLYYDGILNKGDRFILSKGHACLALYSVLIDKGIMGKEYLENYPESLEGHPKLGYPGIEATTGSLGHGLGIGSGMALANRIDNLNSKVIVLMGDAECQEGSVWEAAEFAAKNKLPITAIVDANGLGAIQKVSDDLAGKFKAFGWAVKEINGHDFSEIKGAFSDEPLAIIAHTIKGKGVSFMENNYKFHTGVPTPEEYELAYKELC